MEVSSFDDEGDFGEEVTSALGKMRKGVSRQYVSGLSSHSGNSHVEARIVHYVAKLHPGVFSDLEQYCRESEGFMDETVSRFYHEIPFYMAFVKYIEDLEDQGLAFCYPTFSRESKAVSGSGSYDLALAKSLAAEVPGSSRTIITWSTQNASCW